MKITLTALFILTILSGCGSQNSSKKAINSDTIALKSEKASNENLIDTSAFIKKNYGIGKVRLIFDRIGSIKNFTYSLYSQPSQTSEKKDMKLMWNEDNNGYVEAVNDEIIKIRDYHIDEPYYIILFDCLKEKNGFYEIVINEKTRDTKWIKSSETVIFEPWSVFLQNVVCVSQIDTINNPVRREPHENSEIISNSDGCWDIENMNDVWIKVKYSEIDFDLSDPKINEFHGWIKWRDNDKFIIHYFLAD